jgi:hypothetical protein
MNPKRPAGDVPNGGYEESITDPVVGALFGRMAGLWPHIEEQMISILTELLGGDADLPSRQIFRSIVAAQARIKIMRSLLQRTEINEGKAGDYDDILDDFTRLNDLRNSFLHGLWYTHESGRVFFVENSIDDVSLFHAREVFADELRDAISRMTELDDRIRSLVQDSYNEQEMPLD